jgi:hypothetical protein
MKHKMPEVGEIALAWASQQEDLYEFSLSRVGDDGKDVRVQLTFRDGDRIVQWPHIFTEKVHNFLRDNQKYSAVRGALDLIANDCRENLSRTPADG